jgi:hypothetical protein
MLADLVPSGLFADCKCDTKHRANHLIVGSRANFLLSLQDRNRRRHKGISGSLANVRQISNTDGIWSRTSSRCAAAATLIVGEDSLHSTLGSFFSYKTILQARTKLGRQHANKAHPHWHLACT